MTSRPEEFDAVPLGSVLARWDEVVESWGLDHGERSALLGGFEGGGAVDDVETYDHAKGEKRMRLLVEFAPIIARVHGHQRRTRFWLRAPNRHLGGASPIDVMASSTAWTRWLIDHVGLTA